MTSRRGFLRGLVGGAVIIAAPAIIREGFAMPVKVGLGEPAGLTAANIKEQIGRIYSAMQDREISPWGITWEPKHTYLTPGTLFTRDFSEFSKQRLGLVYDPTETLSPEHLNRALMHESIHARGIPHISLDNDIMSRIQNPPIHPNYTAGHQRQTWHSQQQLHKWFTDNPRKLERIK